MVKLDYIQTGKGNSEKHYQINRATITDQFPIVDRVQGQYKGDLLLEEVPPGTVEYQRVKKVLDRGVLKQHDNGRRVSFDELCDKLK